MLFWNFSEISEAFFGSRIFRKSMRIRNFSSSISHEKKTPHFKQLTFPANNPRQERSLRNHPITDKKFISNKFDKPPIIFPRFQFSQLWMGGLSEPQFSLDIREYYIYIWFSFNWIRLSGASFDWNSRHPHPIQIHSHPSNGKIGKNDKFN